jgi:hypothetical protein
LGEETGTRTFDARPHPFRGVLTLATLLVAAVALAACGSDDERQDAAEPSGDFPIEVTESRFAPRQRLAQTRDLRLAIENVGEETVPDLAVTLWTGDDKARLPFGIRSDQPGLTDPTRPVWILENEYPKLLAPGVSPRELDDEPSAGAEAAQTDTFSFGELEPNESKDIVWRVTPVMAGTFTVHYEIAAGLQGNAKAVTPDGNPVEGRFVVTISDRPPQARVGNDGEVIIEE